MEIKIDKYIARIIDGCHDTKGWKYIDPCIVQFKFFIAQFDCCLSLEHGAFLYCQPRVPVYHRD